jgi:hypothetical protein
MKKLTILLAIFTISLIAVPALANNIVVNGDFETGPYPTASPPTQNAPGWSLESGGRPFFDTLSGLGYYATTSSSTILCSIYQVADASTSDGWINGGTSESYDFKFDYQQTVANLQYGFFYSTDASAPAFGNLANPGAGWTLISAVTTRMPQTTGAERRLVEVTGTLEGINPQWFLLAFEGTSYPSPSIRANFDNVSLTTSSAVPVPPSLLLLGSGLLGMGVLRFRKLVRS